MLSNLLENPIIPRKMLINSLFMVFIKIFL